MAINISMNNLFDIKFAKLNFSYDRERLKEEIQSIQSHFKMIPAMVKWAKPHEDIFVGTPEEINNVTVVDHSNNIIQKSTPTWFGMSLTHLPGHPESLLGSNKFRNIFSTTWIWRDDVKFSYTKELVESLDFKQLNSVRILMLPANGIGLVHTDSTHDYYKKNISITLNVATGGSPLIFTRDGKQYSVQEETAFLFQDDCPHGVPRVTDNRIQLRINGKPNKELLEKLVEYSTVI